MALHYILDGYNIIYKVSSLWSSSIQKSREKLIRYIQNNRPQGSLKNKVTIVFDGTTDVPEYPQATYPIEVIFTHKITADAYIIQLIKKAANPKIMVVVSDDRGIQEKARLSDAKIISVKTFFPSPAACRDEKDDLNKSFLTGAELREIKDELLGRSDENKV